MEVKIIKKINIMIDNKSNEIRTIFITKIKRIDSDNPKI